MPATKQRIDILRYGLPPCRTSTHELERHPAEIPFVTSRDHWQRLTAFYHQPHSSARYIKWINRELVAKAHQACRTTSLGIVDTIAREFITYVVPLVYEFLAEPADDDPDIEREKCLAVMDELRIFVLEPLCKLDDRIDADAQQLKETLLSRTHKHLNQLYRSCEDYLDSSDSPESIIRSVMGLRDPDLVMSNARILDSTLVWHEFNTSNTQKTTTLPRKRRHSEALIDQGADPADNGAVWRSPGHNAKRPKFELEVRYDSLVKDSEVVCLDDDGEHWPIGVEKHDRGNMSEGNPSLHVGSLGMPRSSIRLSHESASINVSAENKAKTECLIM